MTATLQLLRLLTGPFCRDPYPRHVDYPATLVEEASQPFLLPEIDEHQNTQEHLDHAAEGWTGYNEPALLARVWCLKASCSAEAGEFAAAAASLKTAQKLAEEAGDVPLVLCAMSNRAICEIRLGDCKAAATRSRRAFIRAEAENDPEMTLKAQCIR